MSQIVHDLAPGAKLAFATANGGVTTMADNIRSLRNAHGSSVIVDDVTYFVEPMFQDGLDRRTLRVEDQRQLVTGAGVAETAPGPVEHTVQDGHERPTADQVEQVLVDALERLSGRTRPNGLGTHQAAGECHDERRRHPFATDVGHGDAKGILAKRDEVEKTYIAAAREVGELLLQEGAIPQAWMYLRTIREPQKIAAAIETRGVLR